MKILFITKHNPYGNGGGAIATRNFIKLFSELACGELDLMLAGELKGNCQLNQYIRNFIYVPKRNVFQISMEYPLGIFHRYRSFRNRISPNKYDYIVLDKSDISSTFVRFLNKKNVKTFTIHHNFETEYFLAESKVKNSLLKAWLVKKISANEKCAYLNSYYNIFLTVPDKIKFENAYGRMKLGKDVVLTPFIESANLINLYNTEKKFDIIISCSLGNGQNTKAIYNFFNLYYSDVKPYSIIIAGRNPSIELKNFLDRFPNVNVYANPDDSALDELLKQSKIYLCPIENGGGIKVRCFDAIKNLMPAIIHINSVRGYEQLVEAGLFIPYSDSSTLSDAFKKLEDAEMNLTQYKSICLETYSFKSNLEKIKAIM